MSTIRRLTIGAAGSLVLAAGGAWAIGALSAVVTTDGQNAGDYFGWATAAAGDVDGDGTPDVIVSSYAGGYVLVVSGADGSVIHTLKGDASAEFGYCVAGIGDVDGDGHSDLAVGAPSFKGGLGAVYMFSGADGSQTTAYYGDNGSDGFGNCVASAGDVDADGYPDIVAGARNGVNTSTKAQPVLGYVKVISGNSGKQIWHVWGDASGDALGSSVCGLGDLNGDKQSEFAAGADSYTDGKGRVTGLVRIYDGASGKVIQSLYGDYDYDSFGGSCASAGDVDGDGTTDLVVGAWNGSDAKGNVPGYVRVFSGSDWSTIHTVYGDADYDGFGWAVSGGEDYDGDGQADFVAGMPWTMNDNGDYSGGVRLFSGSDGETIDTVYGDAADDAFGQAVTLLPDLTGDDVPDLLIGAPYADNGGDDAGTAGLYGDAGPQGPQGAIAINGNLPATGSRDVTLDLSWTEADGKVVLMRLRDAGGEWGEWIELADTASWTLPAGDGSKSVEVEFQDDLGSVSETASDDILLDTAGPSGTVSIDAGAAWARGSDVQLGLTSSDGGSGVAKVYVRNQGGTFGAGQPVTAALNWTLAAGNGSRTVEVQFEDAVGNRSTVVSDAISVDADAPSGTLLIANGAPLVTDRNVVLSLLATDTGGSGLREMRIRRGDVTVWPDWSAFSATANWQLAPGDGTKEVQAQFRDLAGNESAVASATVTLDATQPLIGSFTVREPQPYYLPQESVSFDLVADDGSGTGISEARTTWDGGATWTPWTDISAGGPYTPERPALEGPALAQVVVRDRAGNLSAPSAPASVLFVPATFPDAASGGTGIGAMSDVADFDVIGIDLVKGDVLTVGVKAVPIPKKQSFVLSIDLATPEGERLVTGRFPETSRAQGIKGFVAPATGRYMLVVRNADELGTSTGKYTLKIGVRHAKANGAAKGTAPAGEFTFEAAKGSTFSATLKGAGLDPASVALEGPDGAVTVKTKVRKGTVNVNPVKLTAGTGAYTVRFTAEGEVKFTWKATLPKPNAKAKE